MLDCGVDVGAAVTIADARTALREAIITHPVRHLFLAFDFSYPCKESKTASLKNIEEQWKWIAGTQVRNLASIGGR